MGADFGSTHWSLILEAAGRDTPEAQAALAQLCQAYYQPLLAYARRRVDAPDDATQEFFASQVLTGAIFKGADKQRGKFRAWLQAAMRNHLSNTRDHQGAAKRSAGEEPLPITDDVQPAVHLRPPDDAEADAVRKCDRAWALTVLGRAQELLKEQQRKARGDEAYEVLMGFLPGGEGSLADAAARLGKKAGAMKTDVSRFRDKFADAVRFEVSRTVSSPSEVDEEIRALIAAVSL